MSKDGPDPNAPEMQNTALQVISHLYEAVAEGADYEPMFFAMDEVIDQVLGDPAIEEKAAELTPLFQAHFDRAAHVFDIMSRQETETPLKYVESRSNATAVVVSTGQILVANAAFESGFGPAGHNLEEQFATPADRNRFIALARSNAPDGRTIINLNTPKDARPVSVLAGLLPNVELPQIGERAISLMLIKPRWDASTGDLLREAYDLSSAEIEILQSFVETGSVQGVAKRRGRSIRTVRTQLSRVFAQMGIDGQTGLAMFLATLEGLQNGTERSDPAEPRQAPPKAAIRSEVIRISGYATEVLEYGHPEGDPVLLLQSTHPPDLTDALRVRMFEQRLRVIAPLKPGSGRSDRIAEHPEPERMARVYRKVLQSIGVGPVIVAGQASGGLFALEFARQYPDSTMAVCLIDTGVPFRDRSELMELPGTIRRTMVPARYFPNILYLPHRLVASNFRRSRKGEAQVVDYFFTGSPAERELTRTRRDAYDVTRALIDYSFDDTDSLVRNVAMWASDWHPLLEQVARRTRIRFFHGLENRMFRVDRIEAWLRNHNNCDLITAPSAGQLAAFQHPDILTNAISTLVPR